LSIARPPGTPARSTGSERYGSGRVRPHARTGQSGVALAVVVWFLAAMSLLVTGIVSHARVDTRMAQLHVAGAKATAAADGAILLYLADFASADEEDDRRAASMRRDLRVGDRTVAVEILPAAGLIDVGSASQKTLASLFRYRTGMDEEQAQFLAGNVVQSRASGLGLAGAARGKVQVRAPEDLMRIDGVSRTLLDAIRDLVTVDDGVRRGAVNPAYAPPAVLAALGLGDDEGDLQPTPGEREGALSSAGSGGRLPTRGLFRVDAWVQDGGSTWLRRRWVEFGRTAKGEMPWQFNRTEPVRLVRAG
jgi:general secretion pathway protein K